MAEAGTSRTLNLVGDEAELTVEGSAIFAQFIDNMGDQVLTYITPEGETKSYTRDQLLKYRDHHRNVILPAITRSDNEASNPD